MNPASTNPDLPNPFPGLRCFLLEEDYLFFGRQQQIEELVRKLRTNRLVAVVGTSGSGKSSLVRAGLLPMVQGGGMAQAGSAWDIAIMRPGGSPMLHLARSLCEAGLYDADAEDALFHLQATLSRSRNGLVEAHRQSSSGGTGSKLLLVVDQFEELFRFNKASATSQEEAISFVNVLLQATEQAGHNIYIVLTMRSDFLGECSQFLGLAEAVNDGEYLIPRMTRDQIQEAIVGPVQVSGAEIAPRLLFRLLNDVEDNQDQLPVLQHALMRTWDFWQRTPDRGGVLDLEHYEATGGMQAALSRHADEILAAFPTDLHRMAAARLFKTLTERGADGRGIRRPTQVSTLVAIAAVDQSIVRDVIEAFRLPGVTFLMPPVSSALEDSTVIDISHESLMRVWTRLRRWVEEEAQSARIYRRLHDTAELHAENQAGLYLDPDLQIALSWREANAPNSAWANQYGGGFDQATTFLDTSREVVEQYRKEREVARQKELERAKQYAATQARAARLFKRFAGVLALGICLTAGLTVWAFQLREEARRQEEIAQQARQEAQNRATTEASAKEKAQQETLRAEVERGKAIEAESIAKREAGKAREAESIAKNLAGAELAAKKKAEVLVYASKLTLAQSDFETGSGGMALRYLNDCQQALRGWEYQYVRTRLNSKQTFEGNVYVLSVACSPDGKRILTGSADKTAKVRDAETGQVLLTLNCPEGWVFSAAYSPDGKQIATSLQNGIMKVWDALTGQPLLTIQAHTTHVLSVSFSPDGRQIATSGSNGLIKVWNAMSGQLVHEFKVDASLTIGSGSGGSVAKVSFSRDGTRLVATSSVTKIWNAVTGQEILQFNGSNCLACSPDNKLIATGSGSKIDDFSTAKLWDGETGKELRILIGHTSSVLCIAVSPDGKRIVTGSADQTAKVWDTFTGKEIFTLKGHTEKIRDVAFSPDGNRILTGSEDGTLRVWDANRGQQVPTIRSDYGFLSVAISPDGERVAAYTWYAPDNDLNSVKIWNASGEELLTLNGNFRKEVRSIAFSPDGTRLATASLDGTAKVWDALTGQLRLTLQGHQLGVTRVAFSPDGKHIATGSDDFTARVWNADTGELIKSLDAHKIYVVCVAFSPDGKYLLTGGHNRSIMVWDTEKWELRLSRPSRGLGIFSPDGKRIAIDLGHGVAILDSVQGTVLQTFRDQSNRGVNSLAFSPDSKRVFSGNSDDNVQVWDTESGQELLMIKGTKRNLNLRLAISADGKRLVTGTEYTGGSFRILEAASDAENPSNHWPFPDKNERIRSHTSKARQAEFENQPFAAKFHWERVLRDDPVNAAARTGIIASLARTAYNQKKYGLATQIWTEAFARDPKLADNLVSQPRFHAACSAISATAGMSVDEPKLEEMAKSKLRRQALEWLNAELAVFNKLPDFQWPAIGPKTWLMETDLATVREAASIVKLPPDEQKQWQAFWAEVEILSVPSEEHFRRGRELETQGKWGEAVANYRLALRRRADAPVPLCFLGHALVNQKDGDFAEAVELLRKGHELGTKRGANWNYPSARWLENAKRKEALFKRFPALLKGEIKFIDNAERIDFANLAYRQKRYSLATNLFSDALAADPKLDGVRLSAVRYNSACCALLAAAGASEDESKLDDPTKQKLRGQALGWLQAELVNWRKIHEAGIPEQKVQLQLSLGGWLKDSDLASIREPANITKLPLEEQRAFKELWSEVAVLLKPLTVKLEILRAEYGADERRMDVTPQLQKWVTDQPTITLPNAVYNESFGQDPFNGKRKFLQIKYKINGQIFDKVFNENDPIVFTVPNDTRTRTDPTLIIRERLNHARRTLPGDSPLLAGNLAKLCLELLEIGAHIEAEPLLRECLAIREKHEPEDWKTFNTYSMLGGSLLGLKRYAEAEPLLLKGYKGMKEREAAIPPQAKDRLVETVDRLIRLYSAFEKPDEARKWKLEWAKIACELLAMPKERK